MICRAIVLITLSGFLWACGVPGLASCADQSGDFLAQIEPLARKWDDANNLAGQTPRMQLAAQIGNLQSIRREAQDMKPPECAKPVQDALVGSMDATIQGYLDFLAQKSDQSVAASFKRASEQMTAFGAAIAVVRGLAPTPTS